MSVRAARPSISPLALAATFVVALVATLTLSLASAPGARADAAPGLVVTGNWFQSDADFQAVSDSGTKWVRAFIYWSDIEKTRGNYDQGTLGYYDRAIARLPYGTKVLLVVVGTPGWANGGAGTSTPPTDPQDYANFAGTIAKRFAGHVQAYEIWNEEDRSLWWDVPNASRYVSLLRPAYAAIKASDPEAIVVLGGLTGNDYVFLQQVYAAGGKGSFDVVSDHTDTACGVASPGTYQRNPDGRIMADYFLGYREVAKVIQANEGVGTRQSGAFLHLTKPIWLTEFGWSVSQKLCDSGAFAGKKPGGVSEAQQRQYLLEAFHCMAIDNYVQVAFWFSLQDDQTAPDSPRGAYGLERLDGSRRPSFAGFTDYAHTGDHLTEPCGNFNGPTVTFRAPVANHKAPPHNTSLPIDVLATSPTGVGHIALYWNLVDAGHRIGLKTSQIIRTRGGLEAEISWFSWRHKLNAHSIIAVANDLQGNVTRQTVTVASSDPVRRGRRKKNKHHRHH